MEANGGCNRTVHATICEIERGVFYATYADDRSAADTDELPMYQTGKSADDARKRIERRARQLGYDQVWWKESIIAPSFPAEAETVLRQPALTSVMSRRA